MYVIYVTILLWDTIIASYIGMHFKLGQSHKDIFMIDLNQNQVNLRGRDFVLFLLGDGYTRGNLCSHPIEHARIRHDITMSRFAINCGNLLESAFLHFIS